MPIVRRRQDCSAGEREGAGGGGVGPPEAPVGSVKKATEPVVAAPELEERGVEHSRAAAEVGEALDAGAVGLPKGALGVP